jgi:multidrug efflux pump subunit AcrB
MKLTESALRNPPAVAAILALILLFGGLALFKLPLQLFPDIERPQLSVQVGWRAASPQELESEIIEPLERVLSGLPGLQEMDSNIGNGGAGINLTFAVGADMKAAAVDVISRLNRLPPLPRDASPPALQTGADGANSLLTFFFVQQLPGTPGDLNQHRRMIEERIVPRFEAIEGVAAVEVNGGTPDELRISVDLNRAAALGIELPLIARQAARATDVSAGLVEDGRREYTLRFAGRYAPEELGELVLAWREGRPVRLRDVADIRVQPSEARFFSYQNGNPAIGLRFIRESGANVLATLDALRDEVDRVRETELKPLGLDIQQSFDASLFIQRAIGLLSGNLLAGVLLAVGCLWWFLRDVRATLLIATAIPICLLSTFIVLQLGGRSLNVISLAGLAFAVGMVMDAAVVVAENILRLREAGLNRFQAALQGTREVGGALLASTLTTVAVFLPVMTLQDVEGQLFADLALTVSIAVSISLLVALTVLPAAAGRWLNPGARGKLAGGWPELTERILVLTSTRPRQLAGAGLLVALPALLAWALMPQLDYLPPVKRAAVDAQFSFPPGMSPARVNEELAPTLLARMRPFMDGERAPQLSNWYLLLWPGGGTMGARVTDASTIGTLEQIVRDEVVQGLPDTRAFAFEGELFGGFGGSARAISVHLQHADGDALREAAAAAREKLSARFPGANVQVFPNADAATPELRVTPDDRRLAEVGWGRPELADAVRVLGEGLWLGEHFDGDSRLPILLGHSREQGPSTLAGQPLATPLGGVLPLSELASIDTVLSPNQVRRVDGRRSLSLVFDPPADLALEDALAVLETEIVPELRALLPPDAGIRMAGSADRLDAIVSSMGLNFLLALLVLFLLMAAMFRSLTDSALVMASLPLALLGGVLGLWALKLTAGQNLDLLSMIGFVMLLGMVVNTAILLLAQTRSAQARGLSIEDSLREAMNQRLRPVMIAALTGVFGALPMAISPGPGAAIYRGLAAVSVGGIALSLVFTFVLVPVLVRLFARRVERAETDERAGYGEAVGV